jgi:hypothetical protein
MYIFLLISTKILQTTYYTRRAEKGMIVCIGNGGMERWRREGGIELDVYASMRNDDKKKKVRGGRE